MLFLCIWFTQKVPYVYMQVSSGRLYTLTGCLAVLIICIGVPMAAVNSVRANRTSVIISSVTEIVKPSSTLIIKFEKNIYIEHIINNTLSTLNIFSSNTTNTTNIGSSSSFIESNRDGTAQYLLNSTSTYFNSSYFSKSHIKSSKGYTTNDDDTVLEILESHFNTTYGNTLSSGSDSQIVKEDESVEVGYKAYNVSQIEKHESLLKHIKMLQPGKDEK